MERIEETDMPGCVTAGGFSVHAAAARGRCAHGGPRPHPARLPRAENGFVDASIAAFEAARGKSADNVQAWNGLGEAYRRKGMLARARAMWEQSLAREPDQQQVRASLEALDES
jgi:hypothetical protein